MRIIFDIGHPAHVHHFKNVIFKLMERGHRVLILAREKDVTIKLLRAYSLSFIIIGKNYKSLDKKALNQIIVNLKTLKLCYKFKPDLLVGRASPNLAFASFVLSIPFVAFSDTEHAKINYITSFPFAKHVVTPSCFLRSLGRKHLRIDSYFELAYLHPQYFQPDTSILEILGVKEDERYIITRFVSWAASHDIGNRGLSIEMKRKLVKDLSKYVRVFISSEDELPHDLSSYQVIIPPEKMHDVLAFATIFIGEGATMASECAMLGTPAIYVNTLSAGSLAEQENYGLIACYRNQSGLLEKALGLLNTLGLKNSNRIRRQKMLAEKIDLAAFMVWFIENYPRSFEIMKKDPDYQYRFL